MPQIVIVKKPENGKKPIPNQNAVKKFNEKFKNDQLGFKTDAEAINYIKAHKGGIWDTYEAKDFGVTNMGDFSDQQKDAFLYFLSGWLQYYDEITRNKAIKHIIYCQWNPENVKVYICPGPGTSESPIDPTKPPSGTTDPKSPSAPPPPYPSP
jgi:hypothetical protein